MSRKIILLSDGTGKGSTILFRTNVWRIYRALELSSGSQIALFDDGVGTSRFRLFALLGGIFGWGLKRNLLDLYTFLCRNYAPGDHIYGFGFSRGAFTIRVLMQFVLSQGIVADFDSADDLRWKARYLYRKFRERQKAAFRLSTVVRSIRDLLIWPFSPRAVKTRPVDEIRFLGLWDTVDAYGIPVEMLNAAVDRYFFPLSLADRVLDPRIAKACHALSIDDKRATFHPLLWDESHAGDASPCRSTDDERLTQVWFAGAHCNVGGGYADDSLSFISLDWMMTEAIKQGVDFQPHEIDQVKRNAVYSGRLYDPRVGLGIFYSYKPRRLDPPRDRDRAVIPYPKIHDSVVWRMAMGTDTYAPLSLPNNLRIVTSNSRPLFSDRQNIYTLPAYCEALARAAAAYETHAECAYYNRVTQRSLARIEALKEPDEASLELIWDTVWWLRLAYFSILITALAFLAYPFVPSYGSQFYMGDADPGQFGGLFPLLGSETVDRTAHAILEVVRPIVVAAIRTAGQFLPGFAQPWISHFVSHPWSFLLFVGGIAGLAAWGAHLERRTHDRALAAWNTAWRVTRNRWLRDSRRTRLGTAALISAIAALGLYRATVLFFRDGSLIHALASAPDADDMSMEYYAATIARHFVLAAGAAACAGLIVASVVWILWIHRMKARDEGELRETPGFALWLARTIRRSSLVRRLHFSFARQLAPTLVAMAVVVFAVAGGNRVAFSLVDASNGVCPADNPGNGDARVVERSDGEVWFDADLATGCQQSHLYLKRGATYLVRLVDPAHWRLHNLKGDPDSVVFPKILKRWRRGLNLWWAVPFRRYWTRPWLDPIVRVGVDEQAIQSDGLVIKAEATSQLMFFVNDIVVGAPRVYDSFYRSNRGEGRIVVRMISDAVTAQQ